MSIKTGCRVLTNHMVGICHMSARDPGLLYCGDGGKSSYYFSSNWKSA